MVKNQNKNSSVQCDIDMKLVIKDFTSFILGYIIVANTSIAGNIKVDYRLYERSKNEVFQTEFSIINQSSKTLTYKAADFKLYSTAHPQLNVIVGVKCQIAIGHIELQLEANTRPHFHDADKHKLVVKFVATYSKPFFQTEGKFYHFTLKSKLVKIRKIVAMYLHFLQKIAFY